MQQTFNRLTDQFDLRFSLKDWFFLTLGAIAQILSIDIFLAPSQLSPGGVAGIAIIINQFVSWPIGLIMMAFNIPLMFFGFHYLGRFRFLVNTLYVVLLINLGVDFMAPWLPRQLTDDLLLNALYSAVLGGIGSGLIYRGRGTTAGTGVISRVLQIKTGIPISQMYILTDGGIVLIAGLVFGWERALYALLTLFLWGLVTDYVLEGPSVVRTVFIVTDLADEVAQALLSRLQIGVTAWAGQGKFSQTEHTVLFCTVSRPDVNSLRSIVIEVDPQAFVVIGQGHQASGGVLRQPKKVEDSR
jgi:uncharacterized membrane-anchored protein YitT (DUF2179 family)